MSIELTQLAVYFGCVVLGWWLRRQGIAVPGTPPTAPSPSNPVEPGILVDLLKSLLDRLATPAQASAPSMPKTAGNVVHVPIEVAANVKQSQ